MSNLSVAIATYNEEENIGRCLESIVSWVDEIIVVDGGSKDKTVEIARRYGAKVIQTTNPSIFHINKQKALDACREKWILQLDADEVVSDELRKEIVGIVHMTQEQLEKRIINPSKRRLFQIHQNLIEKRDGAIGDSRSDIVAFFVPRRNYFLGHPMRFAGTYPDGVIRLVRKDKAYFPSKSVHEQIHVDGAVSWLSHDLLHYSNPTLRRYFIGANTYTNLEAKKLLSSKTPWILLLPYYIVVKPVVTFVLLFVRHKGVLDGVYGLLFSLLSALHFPVILVKYTLLRVREGHHEQ